MLSQIEATLFGWSDEHQQAISVSLAAATIAWKFWLAASAEAAFRCPDRGPPWKTMIVAAILCRPSMFLFLPYFIRLIEMSPYDYIDITANKVALAESELTKARMLRDSIKEDLEIWEEAVEEVDLDEWWPERHCTIVSDCEALKIELHQADLDVASAERLAGYAGTKHNAALQRDAQALSWTTSILRFIWEQVVWMVVAPLPEYPWTQDLVNQGGLWIVVTPFAFVHHKALLARLLCYLESL